MIRRVAEFIFFGNYFVGILAIALSVESALQLQLPTNSFNYYLLLFVATVMYYTYAYAGPLSTGKFINRRTEWYNRNHEYIKWSQRFLLAICIVSGSVFMAKNFNSIIHLSPEYWLMILIMLLSGLLYYGLLPNPFFTLNLRNTGWLKAFVIGFVWACCVNILSFIILQVEQGAHAVDPLLLLWFFIKNWMFCTVNAIMFDIKDYAHDSNKQLKTFVVTFGLRKTIFYVLIPLVVIGLLSLIAVTTSRHLGTIPILFNLVPFVLLLLIAWSMQKPHSIFYYLTVIDGLILLKALCGIAGMQFVK